MIGARRDDDVVDPRATIDPEGHVGYAVPRAPRGRRGFAVPILTAGLGLVIGGAGLAVLQLL